MPRVLSAQEIALRILRQETTPGKPPGEGIAGVAAVLERMHQLLGNIIGTMGFQALLDRAVHLTKREHVWLEGVRFDLQSPFAAKKLGSGAAGVAPQELESGAVALLGAMVELLWSFIGLDLTLRLLRRVWPTVDERPSASDAGPEEN